MSKLSRLMSVIAISLVGGPVAGVALNWKSWAQQSSPPSPLSASLVERAVNGDGTERYRFVKTVARRSDGSVAVQEHRYYKSSDGVPRELSFRYVQNTQTRKLISIYPQVQGRITSQLSDPALRRLSSRPDAACLEGGFAVDGQTASQTLAGQAVMVRRRQLRSSDGQHHGPDVTEWVSPKLDCFVMRREARSFDGTGANRGTVVMEVVNVTPGEPSAELFAVPPEMKEMSPSEVMTAQNRVQGIQCTDCDRKAMENADRYYFANPPIP